MDFPECGECRNPISKFYCCCQQIYLCDTCINLHHGSDHYLLDETINLEKPVGYISSKKSDLLNKITLLKAKINEIYAKHETLIKSGRCTIISRDQPIVRYAVKCKPEFLNTIKNYIPVQVCLIDESNKLCKLSFPDNKLVGRKITVELGILDFILLEWNKNLVIVGGNKNFEANYTMYLLSEDLNVSQLAYIPRGLSSYFPLINNDILYIIGGRFINNLQKIPINTIYCYDLNTGKELSKLTMSEKRYRVIASMHKGKLWVTSVQEKTIEIFDLETQKSELLQTSLKITENSAFVSNNKDLILFTENRIFILDDKNQFKFMLDLSSFQSILSEETWNSGHIPVFIDDLVIFFGSTQAIFYSRSRNTVEFKEINFNN